MAYGYDKPFPNLNRLSIEEQISIPQGHTLSMIGKDTLIEEFKNLEINIHSVRQAHL